MIVLPKKEKNKKPFLGSNRIDTTSTSFPSPFGRGVRGEGISSKTSDRKRSFFYVLRVLCMLSIVLFFPLMMTRSKAVNAGEIHATITGVESLRPSGFASAVASDQHLYTIREADPLVPLNMRTIRASVDRDVTLAMYGSNAAGLGFGLGQIIRIAGARMTPSTVVVPPGVAVTFRNDDPFMHRIEGPGFTRDLKPGESHRIEPKGKGVLTVSNPTMPGVKAWIVVDEGVIANRWPMHNGKVLIPNVPQGEYTIKVFFEGAVKTSTQTIKVTTTSSVELKELAVAAPSTSTRSSTP